MVQTRRLPTQYPVSLIASRPRGPLGDQGCPLPGHQPVPVTESPNHCGAQQQGHGSQRTPTLQPAAS